MRNNPFTRIVALGLVALTCQFPLAPTVNALPCPSGYCPPDGGDPPPTDQCSGDDGQPSTDSTCNSCSSAGAALSAGLASYWVSEPYVNLRIEDRTILYSPSHGKDIVFQISYRQRGSLEQDPTVFGVGTNWSCSFRAYLIDYRNSITGLMRLHRGGAGFVDYTVGALLPRDGSILTTNGFTFQIEYRDGSRDVFTKSFASPTGYTFYFLTSQSDPAGNTLSFNYSASSSIVQLTSVQDVDGNLTHIYYEDTAHTNQITKVVSPASQTNTMQYDASSGFLTNSTDPIGLASSFVYDAANPGWITNMVTPYGTTAFKFGGVDANSTNFYTDGNVVNRYLKATLPSGGKHLYLYRDDCSGFLSSTYSPSPSISLANTLDNVDQQYRNSFHWNSLQYQRLSTTFFTHEDPADLTATDYSRGRLNHWLLDAATGHATPVLSLQRYPSPDGSAQGQLVWYDYGGKINGNNYIGTNSLPSLKAMVLPDGSTRFTQYTRGGHSQVTQTIASYSALDGTVAWRTNIMVFAANNIDLLEQIGPNGEQVVSNYFAAGNTHHQPDATFDALNQQTSFAYNVNRQLTSMSRPTGLTTTNLYFTSGASSNRLQTTIDLEINRTNSFTWTNDLVYSHQDERGLAVTNTWDGLGRLRRVLYPDGSFITNAFDKLDLVRVVDRMGFTNSYAYDSQRHRTGETNALGFFTLYNYCTCGALDSKRDAAGNYTYFYYDNQGNATNTLFPDSYSVTNWFNSIGQVYQTADGAASHYFYFNNQGLLTNSSNAYGTERGTIFDNEDRPLYVSDANGVTVTNALDLLGRVSTRTCPDGGVEKFGYSARGLIAYTNQTGLSNCFALDPAGRKSFETNANNELICYTNNAAGDLFSLTDGKAQTTVWHWDEYGRMTNKMDQAGAEILRYKYDADNRLTNRWSVVKGATTYVYDPVGNLTNVVYPSSPSVKILFDPLNRPTNMVDAAGTTLYSYTAGGQLFTEDGPFASDTVTNSYVNRMRTSLVLQQPTGTWTNGLIYDPARRLTNVTSKAGTFSYTLGGSGPASPLVKKLLLPNTSYITNTFDSVARELTTALDNSSGSVLDSYAYLYNPANQRTNLTRADASTVSYACDNLGQLTVASSSVSSENRGYTYDSGWNLHYRTNNGTTTTFSVDTRNELTGGPGAPFVYDSNGNLTSSQNAMQIYSYDDENRLTSVQFYTTWRTEFVYDGLGRLRKRLEYAPVGTLSSTTEYIYDSNRVIQERDGGNTPQASYTRGTDLGGSLEGAGGIGGLLARSSGYSGGNWSTHNFYHADGNGNVTYLVSSSQTLAASYRYDPFGNIISKSGSLQDANVYRFSSKEVHVNSGMYYYLYRFYDPGLQRWINRDPLGEPGFRVVANPRGVNVALVGQQQQTAPWQDFINQFSFVGNRPLAAWDAFGLRWCLLRGRNWGFLCSCTPQEAQGRICIVIITTNPDAE